MTSTDFLENIKKMRYESCLFEFRDKSDAELLKISDRNAKLSMAVNIPSASVSELADMSKLCGEIQACKEILAQRQAERERIKQEKKHWKTNLQKRRNKAIMNLSAAATYNGQLVAAILESEDCKTEEEIFELFNGFSEISKEDLSSLLKALVSENILLLSSTGKYYLVNICTDDLFPENPIEWATKKLMLKNQELVEDEIKTISALKDAGEPLERSELEKLYDDTYDADYAIDSLLENDVIEAVCKDCKLYYFPMLGEKKRGKNQ